MEAAKNTRVERAMSMVTGEGDDERRQPSERASGERENKTLTVHSNSFETKARTSSATAAVARRLRSRNHSSGKGPNAKRVVVTGTTFALLYLTSTNDLHALLRQQPHAPFSSVLAPLLPPPTL